jgi:hypothetical protein
MLEKLLESITQSGTVQPAALARQLGVSPALVEQMIADLERGGYLREMDGCAQGQCTGCSSGSACGVLKTRVWVRAKKSS